MLPLLLLSPDITRTILHYVDTIPHIGLLARTSQTLLKRTQIIANLWTNAGRQICGARHWPEHTTFPLGSTQPTFVFDDARYLTMTRVYPWLAAPRRIELNILHSFRLFGGEYSFKSMDMVDHICRLTITLRGGDLLQGGPSQPLLIRTDAYGLTARFNTATRINRPWQPKPPSQQEEALLRELRRTQWRPTTLYETDIIAVRVVHDGLLCVMASCSATSPLTNSILYFVSTRTRSVLHTHRFFTRQHWNMSNIVFRAGEIWIYEDYLNVPTLTYFGPSHEHMLNLSSPELNRRDAFWAMAKGDANHSVKLLRKHHTDAQIYKLQENGRFLVEAATASLLPEALNSLMEHLPGFARAHFMYRVLDTGHLDMATVFLTHGTNPAADDSEALRRVIRSRQGSVELIDMLLAKGAVLKPCCMLYCVRPWTPVEIVARRLLPSGKDPRPIKCTHEENPLFVEWLLGGGCLAPHMYAVAEACPDFVNQSSSVQGWTPLMLAAGTLDQANVECLLALKADVNVCDKAHHSALDWCIAAGADVIPDWYSDAYYDQDAPACYEHGEVERAVHSELILDLLTAAVERSSAASYS